MESNITRLKQYSSLIDVEDFTDYLISKAAVTEQEYLDLYETCSKNGKNKLYEIFNIIEGKSTACLEDVFTYLDNKYPNIKQVHEDEIYFRISSIRGGLPRLPPNYVKRKTLAERVKSKLQDIQWNKKLVIYGMVGYGKSCLVNEVLNDIKIRKYFDFNVFWIHLGEHHTVDNVLQPMSRLYYSVCSVFDGTPSPCPDDVQILQHSLRNLFLKSKLMNALIILDDVCNKEVLSFFDLGCRTVVTTQDKNILGKEDADFIEVKTGFSIAESLELFKTSLCTNKELPLSADEICAICKGHPMLIAMIGSYLGENKEYFNNEDIWQYIKTMILSGNYRLNEFDEQTHIPTEILAKCVEKLLTKELKTYYEDFAIFLQDVNIPITVFETLWGIEPFRVKNILNKLVDKSLIVAFYYNDLKNFIYGIHDIHLNYLKEETKQKIKDIHRKLVKGYNEKTGSDFSKLPNDNYALQFIGYHLCNAGHFDRFDIYFNLKFIEAKIKAVGKEDVLRDMVKYEEYITRKDRVLKERLDHYKDFVLRIGANLYNNKETDIIQYALQERKDTYVFEEAHRLAKESNLLYFQFQQPVDDLDYSETIHVNDDITTACFVDSPHHILVGTTNGKIKLFFENYEREISDFVNSDNNLLNNNLENLSAIKSLHVSPTKTHFLSVSDNGVVRLWKFLADRSRNSIDLSVLPISPKTKQLDWQDIYTPDRGKVFPKQMYSLKNTKDYLISANFASSFPDTNRIVTGTREGNVIIWDAVTGAQLCETKKRGFEVHCVLYLVYDLTSYVVYPSGDSIVQYMILDGDSEVNVRYAETLHAPEKCQSIFLRGWDLIAVGDKSVTVWHGRKPHPAYLLDSSCDKKNICSTVTDDSRYLVVSTNDSTVYFYDFEENRVIREFENKGLPKSLDTFYDENNSVHILLIGSDKKTLQQCHIQPCNKEPRAMTSPKIIPFWRKKQPLTAVITPENTIQIFRGYTEISETDVITSPVTCTCFSIYGNAVLYGLTNGEIHQFNIKSKTDVCLENVENRTGIKYVRCYNLENEPTCNHSRSTSLSSGDSLLDNNLNMDCYMGTLVAISQNDVVTIYKDLSVFVTQLTNPYVFLTSNNNVLVLLDNFRRIYTWNLENDDLRLAESTFDIDVDCVTTATMCRQKMLLAVGYKQGVVNEMDVVLLSKLGEGGVVQIVRRIRWIDELSSTRPNCCEFSADGSLLAVGMESGVVHVYNVKSESKPLKLLLHQDCVEQLLFFPSLEPILISLSEHAAWWNLKGSSIIQKPTQGKPKRIEILDNPSSDINISYWLERQSLPNTNHLLSSIKFHGRPKFISASKDYNNFLTIDDKGKIYIMEVVT